MDTELVTTALSVLKELPPELFADCDLLIRFVARKLVPLAIQLSPYLSEAVSICDATSAVTGVSCTDELVDLVQTIIERLLEEIGVRDELQMVCDAYAALPSEVRWLLSEGIVTIQALASGDAATIAALGIKVGRVLTSVTARAVAFLVGTATDVLANFESSISSIFPPGATDLAKKLAPGAPKLVKALGTLAAKVMTSVAPEALGASYDLMEGIITADYDEIVSSLETMVDAITSVLSDAFGALEDFGGDVLDALGSLSPF